ncbi:FliM/FliN family flagellar motor switch protein [Pseudorhodobacter sp.]|uniref:FliM/FliN family flagellar motor switch protein n=1 Tax=Pseudorhodobacter sp. TaxID=1934400 RepID=UPI002647109D|nr:FliM/FliN family flagellar motor switch protein [Pseudorhodobacter sp.]
MEQNGIRRKITHARNAVATVPVKGAAKAWKLALARAARDTIGLEVDLTDLQQDRRALAELLDLPPERALVLMLAGPKEGLGLMIFGPEILAGIVEMQMMGRVSMTPPIVRRPTRTDAAMVSTLIDRALSGLEQELERDADLVWTSGFRYASFLEDARPLSLLLEDVNYQVLRAELALAGGAKSGLLLLALPADGRGRPPQVSDATPIRAAELVFAAALGEQVMSANAELVAVLAHLKLPIDAVLQLKTGDILPLTNAGLDQINLEGLDGTRLSGGKLGQNRGMRAIRMMETAPAARIAAPKPVKKQHLAQPLPKVG